LHHKGFAGGKTARERSGDGETTIWSARNLAHWVHSNGKKRGPNPYRVIRKNSKDEVGSPGAVGRLVGKDHFNNYCPLERRGGGLREKTYDIPRFH